MRPRPRRNRVFDTVDACHLLGVAVAVFPASGLGYDEVCGEAHVASWVRSRGCPALLVWRAVHVSEEALDAADLNKSTGVVAGLSMVAFGPWAGRAGRYRRWPDGRGLFVEFTTVGDPVVVDGGIVVAATVTTKMVGGLFGPATGDIALNHKAFHMIVTAEWRECRLAGLSPLFMGGTGFAPPSLHRPGYAPQQAPVDTRAWLDSK